ncbi:DNA-3-methyladenine glycosylase I [Vibrio sp. TBV020]|uniref:DNA-3-methyladenine glycosylase I n=1 Tax=Vibrio sp. TBV020 TaxID=3137398 RepID=UPI0038CD4EDA
MEEQRCAWANVSELDKEYHDTEWGVPVHDDNLLFEMLSLEGAQAGLSWTTILKKREGYRSAFYGFDIDRVSQMTEQDVESLVVNPDIVRHRGKIESVINNAKQLLLIKKEFGSVNVFFWAYVNNNPIVNKWQAMSELPSSTELSKQISKDLKKRGFKFVGPTTVYAFMQAAGLVDDHLMSCPAKKKST